MKLVTFGKKYRDSSKVARMYGTPDLDIDACVLPNPYSDWSLKNKTGLDDEVVAWMDARLSEVFISDMSKVIRQYGDDATVFIHCYGGKHRSVYMAEKLKTLLADKQIEVSVVHMELEK